MVRVLHAVPRGRHTVAKSSFSGKLKMCICMQLIYHAICKALYHLVKAIETLVEQSYHRIQFVDQFVSRSRVNEKLRRDGWNSGKSATVCYGR